MPSDYERILEQNLHEYGHGDRQLKLLGELYPQRTHFIHEAHPERRGRKGQAVGVPGVRRPARGGPRRTAVRRA